MAGVRRVFVCVVVSLAMLFALLPPGAALAEALPEAPYLEVIMQSTPAASAFINSYLSDPLFRDSDGIMHLGPSGISPHDGLYTRSTDSGQTWSPRINITREATASKGGTIYVNNTTKKGLYMGFFNVSGYNLNYTYDGGLTWTTGAYRFIPGSSGGLTSYLYPLGSAYDGENTVYAVTWSSYYHWGNGKAAISKSTDLGTTWTSMAGVANSNTMLLDSNDRYAIDAVDLIIDADGVLYVLYLANDTQNKWNLKAYNSATSVRETVVQDLGYTRFGVTGVTAWFEQDGKSLNVAFVRETGPNEASAIYHTRRDVSGTWSEPEIVGTDGLARRPSHLSSAIDAEANTYVIWSNYDGARNRMFSSAKPAGAAWGPVTEVLTDDPTVSAWTPWMSAVEPGVVEVVFSRAVGSARSAGYAQMRLANVAPADDTPPLISAEISGVMGEDGWYVSDVVIIWNVSDEQSEITSIIGGEPIFVTEDTEAAVYTCQATSLGGTSELSVVIKRDATAPEIVVVSPLPGAYSTADSIVFEYSASDSMSGLASVSAELNGTVVSAGDTFSLAQSAGANVFTVVAQDVAGNQITSVVHFDVLLSATLALDPKTLNVGSQADKNAVTAYIEFGSGYEADQVDVTSVRLRVGEREVCAQTRPVEFGDYDRNGIGDLMLKFNRQEVISALGTLTGDVSVKVTGKMLDGTAFESHASINVINPGVKVRTR